MILTDDTREAVEDPIEAMRVSTGQTGIGENTYILVAHDASELQIECTTAVIAGLSGRREDLIGMVVVFRDISERKRTEQALKASALVDELTGLYNRRGFMALAEQQMRVAQRFANEVTVFFADLDGLKRINDTLGHQSGDEAISAAATVIRRCFRKSDIIARLGGDEFAVLAVESRRENSSPIGLRLQSLVDEWNAEPGRAFVLSISLGTSHSDANHPLTLDEMLEQADQLMYINKKKKYREVLPP
jgi:diguanylate cyclase (GGDEF)-like protein